MTHLQAMWLKQAIVAAAMVAYTVLNLIGV